MTDQSAEQTSQDLPEREAMEFDVVIVGAGPAGLSAAIRLMQKAQLQGKEISVVVLEKGSEVGAHILSGAVIDPVGVEMLFPDWKDRGAPLQTPVKEDRFLYLGGHSSVRLMNFLMPPLMNNHGNYIVSLGDLTRWLGEQATELGVEIYPGFAATEVLYDEQGRVYGVATGDMGVGREGEAKDTYMRGMELHGKYVLFGEGARGSLSKTLIAHYNLDADCDPQKFGIGLKEIWEVDPKKHVPGRVQHSFGWPLDNKTGGGSFLYHFGENLVTVGFVVHLNYTNPYLSPYNEFQRFKTHPDIRETFENGKRIGYGARAITEGGWQAMPKLVFPGGALLGCSAGMVNVPRIKGTHNAMLSGVHAADAVIEALGEDRARDELVAYEKMVRTGPIAKDLKKVRNVKPFWSRFGTFGGVLLGGLDMWLNTIISGVGLGFTLKHGKPDSATLKPARQSKKIDYPRPDGVLTFDRLTNVSFSATNHEEDQPVHLKLKNPDLQKSSEHDIFDGPSNRYCPAGVYEWVDDGEGGVRFQINAQNCVHCKTSDIKDPNQNITWTCPEGAGGPNYTSM